jgi:hypothetical protein
MDARRQRLDKMVRRYAYDHRIPFGVAWAKLEEHLRASMVHIDRDIAALRRSGTIHLQKDISTPYALELTGKLDTALRIAQRMLGKK